MAKERENKTAKGSIIDMISNLDSTSVEESLKETNKMEQEVREMAEAKMKEEEKKEKADELIRKTKQAVYTNLRLLIETKYLKGAEEAMATARNKSLELLTDLKDGKITPTEYIDKLEEMVNEQIKEIEKVGKKRRENMRELENSYVSGGYYLYSWNNPFNRINRAIENNKNLFATIESLEPVIVW